MAKVVVVICFLVAFAAGLAAGIQWYHSSAEGATTQPARSGNRLADELGLTPRQREELDKIWSDTVQRGGREREEERRRLIREREDEIAALIRPDDKTRYDEILRRHSEKMTALEHQWSGSFQAAVEKTQQLLNDKQRAKYEEIRQRRQKERGPHDWRRGDRDRDPGRRSPHRSLPPGTRPMSSVGECDDGGHGPGPAVGRSLETFAGRR